MGTENYTSTTPHAAIIASTRAARAMSLRDFGAALGISYQQVANLENSVYDASREDIARWIASDVPWVKSMGLHLFGAKFGTLIQNVLVPTP